MALTPAMNWNAPSAGTFGSFASPLSSLTTSFGPMSGYEPYDENFTKRAMNQALGQRLDMASAIKPYYNPGISIGAGQVGRANADIARNWGQAAGAASQIPMQHFNANNQMNLQAQQGQAGEALGLGNLLSGLSSMGIARQNRYISPILQGLGDFQGNILSGLLGGLF